MDLQRVLFVCVGNACRSQMAEGFALVYGKDVMKPESAGLAPAFAIPIQTRQTMAEKNIDISTHFPKPVNRLSSVNFDLIINMSGHPIPGFASARDWNVRDPIGRSGEEYRSVRDQIEQLVTELIGDLRRSNEQMKNRPTQA